MKTKKEIKQDLETQRIVTKRKNFILYIVLIILLIIVLIDCIVVYQSINPKYSSIKDSKGNVYTTEFCTHWFNMTKEQQDSLDTIHYKNISIPKPTIIDVCKNWLEIKKEVDSKR